MLINGLISIMAPHVAECGICRNSELEKRREKCNGNRESSGKVTIIIPHECLRSPSHLVCKKRKYARP